MYNYSYCQIYVWKSYGVYRFIIISDGKYNKLHIRRKVRIINKNILVTTRSSYKFDILLDEIDFI